MKKFLVLSVLMALAMMLVDSRSDFSLVKDAQALPGSTEGVCPKVGDPAAPEGEGLVLESKAVVAQDGSLLCATKEEGWVFLPPASRSGGGNLASESYFEDFCNVEVAGHEQFNIEMWDQHLHQRYWYDYSDVLVLYDGRGELGGVKTVQWWTDVVWAGQADWWSIDGDWEAWGLADGYYSTVGASATVYERCQVYNDGGAQGYWYAEYTQYPFWHVHGRIYGGYPPDW